MGGVESRWQVHCYVSIKPKRTFLYSSRRKTSSVVECISLLESGFACVILLTYFGQLHQRVHLFLRPFKVLDAKCIYGHHFHS